MLLSVCVSGASAANAVDAVPVSYEEDLKTLDRDVPVIFVTGLEGEYYKGLSTETEDDDVRIWGPDAGVIVSAVFKNIVPLVWNLIIGDYKAVNETAKNAVDAIFGDFACDSNGVPNPDTGKKVMSDYGLREGANGYSNDYDFIYDWRCDMLTIAAQLDEYTDYVMELTGSDKVAYVAMSMGNAVMTTYLHEYYYAAEDYSERNHIDSVIFLAGAMNGVGTCEDPFSGNMGVDSKSILRMMSELMLGNEGTKGIYYFVEILYSLGLLEPITAFVNNLNTNLVENGLNDAVLDTLATIPGFMALMSPERYEETRAFIYDTPEKQAKFAAILEKSDYYHRTVQKNNVKVIQSMLDDGIRAAVIAEYGCTVIPLTSDNDRMSDGTIFTAAESFGATCAEVDGTLGEGYTQAKECDCGKNHISADNQIDASTCAFPDITWFAKNVRHSAGDEYFEVLCDLIIYADRQITVWDYTEYPQYLINLDGESLVPLTAENAGEIVPYDETTLLGKARKKLGF